MKITLHVNILYDSSIKCYDFDKNEKSDSKNVNLSLIEIKDTEHDNNTINKQCPIFNQTAKKLSSDYSDNNNKKEKQDKTSTTDHYDLG